MDDILILLNTSVDEVLTGTYYPVIPKIMGDGGETFQYDIVNESDRTYSRMLEVVKNETSMCTIKTNDECGFKINGYVATQDGAFWQIQGVVKHLVNKNSKQALRLLKETAETEYVVRLIEVPNPWGLK
jgi:hypothetical protein